MVDHPYGGTHSIECLTAAPTQFTGYCPGPSTQRHGWGLGGVAMGVRLKAVASPIYLADKVLSCMWKANLFDRPSEAHRLVEKAMIEQRDTLYVDARGTAKTTLLDECGTVSQFLRFPNDNQLITHSVITNSKGISNSIRLHLTSNMIFRSLFPDYALDGAIDAGNILAWSIPCRTLGGVQESVEVATPNSQTAGRHYDVVRSSDWMNELTTPLYGRGSIEEMLKLVALFSQIIGMLNRYEVNPRAHWTCDSNRWADGDLAGSIIRNDIGNRVVKVVRGVTGEPGNFRSSWPEVQSSEDIQRIWESPAMTTEMFAANYRGEPMANIKKAIPDDRIFDYEKEPAGLDDIAITVDPAFSDSKSEAKKTDRSGIVVTGLVPKGRSADLYVLDSRAGRWGPTEFLDNLFQLMDFWKPKWVGIEETPSSRAIIALFQHECRQTGRWVNYREIKPGGQSKVSRIASLHNIAIRWGVYMRRAHNRELIEEMVRYGVAQHDDLVDALAYRAQEIIGNPIAALLSNAGPTVKRRLCDVTPEEALAFCEPSKTRARYEWLADLEGRN